MPLLRAAAAWVFTAAFCLALGLAQALTLKRLPYSLIQSSIRWWGRTTLAVLGIRLELLNASTLEERAPRVLVCNHQSALDAVWMSAVMPPAPLALGKKEFAWIPFVNIGWWAVDFLLVDRKDPNKARRSLRDVVSEISARRRSLVVAPEGTRSREGSIGPFKRGAFWLAVRSQASICPVVVSGAFELLPRHRWLPLPGVIRLQFLPPVSTRGLGESSVDALMERVRRDMCEAYEGQRRMG